MKNRLIFHPPPPQNIQTIPHPLNPLFCKYLSFILFIYLFIYFILCFANEDLRKMKDVGRRLSLHLLLHMSKNGIWCFLSVNLLLYLLFSFFFSKPVFICNVKLWLLSFLLSSYICLSYFLSTIFYRIYLFSFFLSFFFLSVLLFSFIRIFHFLYSVFIFLFFLFIYSSI